MKKILLIFSVICFSTAAQAQLVFSPGIHYSTSEFEATTGNTTNSESATAVADLRLGYILPMGLYLGGMYSHISGKSDATTDIKGHNIGPSIGYHSMVGFYLIGTYHITGEFAFESTASNRTYTGGKGPQVDMGWVFPIASSFAIGPQLTWRSIEYNESEVTGSAAVTTDQKITGIDPYISLWFMF